MAYTDVQICNLALGKLGENPISSLSGTDKVSVLCNQFFQHTVNLILSLFDWSAVIKRSAELTPDAETPATGFDYQYTLPADCLYVLEIVDSSLPYRLEQNKLLTDMAEDVYLRYVMGGASGTYGKLGALLVEAVACQLAATLAMPISKSPKLADAMEIRAQGAILQAEWHDAKNRQEADPAPDLWVDAQETDLDS